MDKTQEEIIEIVDDRTQRWNRLIDVSDSNRDIKDLWRAKVEELEDLKRSILFDQNNSEVQREEEED